MRLSFIILTTLILLLGTTAKAQSPIKYKRSTLVKELKYNIKDKDYKKAIENVKKDFEQYPEQTKADAEFYYYSSVANHNMALAEARKMYLQDKPDTVKYFDFIYVALTDGRVCDSLANIPNEKGRVVNKFHKGLIRNFSTDMTKLPAGARFFFQKKDYGKAYDFADLYISMTDSIDSEAITVATVSVLAAYARSEYQKAVRHTELALSDSLHHEQILEVVCNCLDSLKDTLNYKKRLQEGVDLYPRNKYFYASLVNQYNSEHRFWEALKVVEDVLEADCCNRDLWFIKGTEEMHLSERDKALTSFLKAVEIKADDADSYSNIGNIYLHKAHYLYEQQANAKGKELRSLKAEMNTVLIKAKDAFENSRQYAEHRPEIWLAGLKEVYYKLNMGKELMLLERKYP